MVAGVLISNHPVQRGVAPQATLFSFAVGDNADPRFSIDGIEWLRTRPGNLSIVNLSYGAPPQAGESADGETLLTHYLDHTANVHDTLFVLAGNENAFGNRTDVLPADAYNGLTVGATTQRADGTTVRFDQLANFNSSNTTDDNRSKTDLVAPGGSSLRQVTFQRADGSTRVVTNFPSVLAPGESIVPGSRVFVADSSAPLMPTLLDTDNNGVLDTAGFAHASGTSFAAPQVAGAAALIREQQDRLGLVAGHLPTKAILLNSASKHVLTIDPDGAAGPLIGTPWPLTPAAILSGISLDPGLGVGQLNGYAAIRQTQDSDSARGLFVETSTLSRSETRNIVLNGGKALDAGSLVTATLTWDRNVTNPSGDLTNAAAYVAPALPNLDLQLVNLRTGAVVGQSNSVPDNVEHLYFNVPGTDPYALRVVNLDGSQDPTFALAASAGSSNGPAFSVDGGAFNTRSAFTGEPARGNGASPAANPAEGLPNPYPNDVNALGTAGPGFFPTEGEIFTSALDGTNITRLSGALGTMSRVGPFNGPPAALSVMFPDQRGVLGLQANDNIAGLSWGTDGTIEPNTGHRAPGVLLFSVDPFAIGAADTAVFDQSVLSGLVNPVQPPLPINPGGGDPGHEAAGDIFYSMQLDPFGRYASVAQSPAAPFHNHLLIDEAQLGLQAPADHGSLALGAPERLPGASEDNLDALEMDSPLDYVDPDGNGLHNRAVFFTLDRWSPSLGGSRTPDDIFTSLPPDPAMVALHLAADPTQNPGFSFDIFADGQQNIDLLFGDAIDALVLSDVGTLGQLTLGDEALFSLDPQSPSIPRRGARPGDVYYTDFLRPFNPTLDWKAGGSLYASAEQLGLRAQDNLDALDIRRVPEPGTVALLATASLSWLLRRRRRVS